MSKDELRALAALAAKSAPIRKIETGACALGYTGRQWAQAVRGEAVENSAERRDENRRQAAHESSLQRMGVL